MDTPPTDKAVTNLVKDLRQRLKMHGIAEELLETIYGLGYRLNPPPNVSSTPLSPAAAVPLDPDKREKWIQGTAQLASRFQASLKQRLDVLEDAIQSLEKGEANGDRCQQAQAEAHRLAGGLGTFGYEHGSTLARAIEQQFALPSPPDLPSLTQLLADLKQTLAQPSSSQSRQMQEASSPLSIKTMGIRVWWFWPIGIISPIACWPLKLGAIATSRKSQDERHW